jgi:hypothetical protein
MTQMNDWIKGRPQIKLMDFSPKSNFNNFYREEIIFRVWNIFDRKGYYGTLTCAP